MSYPSYVTRTRAPGDPHPGFDEIAATGTPTGRILKAEARFPYSDDDFEPEGETLVLYHPEKAAALTETGRRFVRQMQERAADEVIAAAAAGLDPFSLAEGAKTLPAPLHFDPTGFVISFDWHYGHEERRFDTQDEALAFRKAVEDTFKGELADSMRNWQLYMLQERTVRMEVSEWWPTPS